MPPSHRIPRTIHNGKVYTIRIQAGNFYILNIGAVIPSGVNELHLSCSQQSPFAAIVRRFSRPSWRNASHCWIIFFILNYDNQIIQIKIITFVSGRRVIFYFSLFFLINSSYFNVEYLFFLETLLIFAKHFHNTYRNLHNFA